jgi:hypothetical protein
MKSKFLQGPRSSSQIFFLNLSKTYKILQFATLGNTFGGDRNIGIGVGNIFFFLDLDGKLNPAGSAKHIAYFFLNSLKTLKITYATLRDIFRQNTDG